MAFSCLWLRISDLGSELTTSSLRQNSSWPVSVQLALAVYQSSSSDSHCRLKSLKVKADLCLDKVRFLCMAHSGTILFAVNTSGMGKEGRKAQASPWCFYFQHLAMMATPRTGQLWPKCFIKWKISSKYLLMLAPWCPFNRGRSLSALLCAWYLKGFFDINWELIMMIKKNTMVCCSLQTL